MNSFPVIDRSGVDRNKYGYLVGQLLIGIASEAYFWWAQFWMQATFAKVNRPDGFAKKHIDSHSRIRFANNLGETLLNGFGGQDRKSTRLNSSHSQISYAVFCLKKKKTDTITMSSHVA